MITPGLPRQVIEAECPSAVAVAAAATLGVKGGGVINRFGLINSTARNLI